MKKECLFIALILMMVFPLSCAFDRNNPLDEGGTNFTPPKITIDEKASSVKNKDTLHVDSLTISLIGNRVESMFSIKLDTNDPEFEWQPQDTFGIGGLSDGSHMLIINSMYDGGEMVVSDTINFYVLTKGFKPEFAKETDTTIASFRRKQVKLVAPATGASPLQYSWLKDNSILTGKNSDSLKFYSFSIKDTGSYMCVVSNEYGKDSSRTYVLTYRPSTGGIKGIITDTAQNILKGATITLIPSDKQSTTKSDGKFEFNALSEDTYTLMISLTGYENKTVDDIEVNDSVIIEIKEIELLWIDTTTYKMIYNGNGNENGTVPVDSMKYIPSSKVVVLGNTNNLSIKGYSFSTWNTKKDGSGKNFNSEDSITITDDIILYAQWKKNQYALSFNGNNNTSGSAPDDKEYNYNEKVTVPASDSLKRAGYTFKGWNILKNGEGKAYAEQDTFLMPDSNVVLYAQWEAMPTFKVTYNKNDADSGTVPIDNDNYYEGKEVTIAGNPGVLFREGYSFAGWYLKIEGSDESYNAGSKFIMPASAVTFYAKWSTNPTYSIIYHGNTNTNGVPPPTIESDSGNIVTIANSGSLVKTGHTFVEWNTKEDGSGKSYGIGKQITMGTVDINLYAQWTKARYTITYHGNGNTSGTPPLTTNHFYGSEVIIADAGSLQKTGHTFNNWNTDSLGTGIDYSASINIKSISENIELYAKWNKNNYTINFKFSNGEADSNQTVSHGDTIIMPSDPLKQSYIFSGWTNDSNSTQFWDFSTKITEPVTLYAKWIIRDIDGNIYTEVKIGSQVWMVENLKTTKYNDGTSIQYITSNNLWKNLSTGGFCWYDHDSLNNKSDYGALYNWYVVNSNKIAPDGWHVPTSAEWDTLVDFLGGKAIAGGKLKEPGVSHWKGPNPIIDNAISGFIGLPGGERFDDGSFNNLYNFGTWWTATEGVPNTAFCYNLSYGNTEVFIDGRYVKIGFSVRCIRDW